MNMKKTFAALTVLSALVFSLFIVTPANASAYCGSGRVCMWDGGIGGGTVGQAFQITGAACKSLLNQPINNIASSAENNAGLYYVDFYNSQNCSGSPVYNNLPGSGFNQVLFTGSANNVISSFRTSLVP